MIGKLVFAVAFCVCGASADERTVSTVVDLVAALEALNAKSAPAEPNVIYLAPGSYDVSAYHMENWGDSGKTTTSSKHIALANVTVSGKTDNPRDTVIYGDGTDGIIHCYAASLKHLTVSNGWDNGSDNLSRGGGVYGGTHTNVIVTCCQSAQIGGGCAGGTWYDCTIISNRSSSSGGGIYSGTLYNCNIVSNYTSSHGGGCYYGTTLHDCRVIGNQAAGSGGGISATSNEKYFIKVYGGLIAGNLAKKSGGGAAYSNFFGETVVSNNIATLMGGGVYGDLRNFATNIVLCCNKAANGGGAASNMCVSCEIADNISTGNGGGCYGSLCVDCTITNNLTKTYGGGGYGGVYSNCFIACNMATGSVNRTYGGGISTAEAHDCVISNNVVEAFGTTSTSGAAFGAGAYASAVYDSIVTFNLNYGGFRDAYGGGLYGGCASNTLVSGNACYSDVTSGKNIQGGGGYSTAFTNCVIRNNYVRSNSGTGINGGQAYGCLISNNVGSAATAYTVRQVKGLWNCTVVGVVNMRNGPAVNCRFVNFTNGFYLAKGENVVKSGHVAGSTSTDAELFYTGLWATNCLIANNKTSGGLFNAMMKDSLAVRLTNCTIADNICAYTFIEANEDSNAEVVNCIFTGNRTSGGAARNMYLPTGKTNITVRNCLIGSGRTSEASRSEENTITNDVPGFVGRNGPDRYAIKCWSPARGKGLVQDWMADALDIRQEPACLRLRDGMVDIGCYQCWLDPVGSKLSIR